MRYTSNGKSRWSKEDMVRQGIQDREIARQQATNNEATRLRNEEYHAERDCELIVSQYLPRELERINALMTSDIWQAHGQIRHRLHSETVERRGWFGRVHSEEKISRIEFACLLVFDPNDIGANCTIAHGIWLLPDGELYFLDPGANSQVVEPVNIRDHFNSFSARTLIETIRGIKELPVCFFRF